MATVAFKGSQTLLKLGNAASPEVFTTIGEVTSIGALGAKSDLIEVTHMLSLAKEFITGLAEGIEIDVECNYIPTNAQQNLAIITANSGTLPVNFRYVMPTGGGSLTFSFSAIIMSWAVGPTTPNTATKLVLGLKISGSVAGPS